MEPSPLQGEFDPTDRDFLAGILEYEGRTFMRDMLAKYGLTRGQFLIAKWFEDEKVIFSGRQN